MELPGHRWAVEPHFERHGDRLRWYGRAAAIAAAQVAADVVLHGAHRHHPISLVLSAFVVPGQRVVRIVVGQAV